MLNAAGGPSQDFFPSLFLATPLPYDFKRKIDHHYTCPTPHYPATISTVLTLFIQCNNNVSTMKITKDLHSKTCRPSRPYYIQAFLKTKPSPFRVIPSGFTATSLTLDFSTCPAITALSFCLAAIFTIAAASLKFLAKMASPAP